jgi:PAS domain S-box-containing protein
MFRVRDEDLPARPSSMAGAVEAVQILAFLINLGTIAGVLWAFGAFGHGGLGPPGGPTADRLPASPLAWLLLAGMVGVAIIHVLGILALRGVRRRYRESQQSLRRVKLLAHHILASMDEGVVTTDLRGVVTSINSAAGRLLGVDVECVGRPIEGLASEELPLPELARLVLERGEAVRDREVHLPREEGAARRYLLIDAHGLKGPADEPIGCVIHVRDVTERLLWKERMWRMEQAASLGALASGLHHEVKNPLTAVSIHVQLLEESLRGRCPEAPVGELIGVLKAETGRLNGVLEQFRDFASLERLSPRPADAGEILESVARLIGPQAERQGVRLRLRRAETGLPPALLDVAKLEQAVLNLVLNALQAMPEGGELTLAAGPEPDGVWIEVGDTGPGIPPELRDQLFKPYFSTKRRGAGLGLALTEKLVRLHDGRVGFRTGPGGTTFRISLPTARAAEVVSAP